MPTPVSTARQFLTDEAVRALDDAVAVARRRSHSQTTSLHAVSALLSSPTSTLRDACSRARSSACSPRIQFRALELCVSVSLDRLPSPSNKTLNDEPPVSNSLMAAIRRSQGNQRRHPDPFYLYQMQQLHGSQSSLSCVKVELKHFILSILDDPIISRVFGDAGLRSSDIKLAILCQPPLSRFENSMKFPPLFCCHLSHSDGSRNGFSFPFVVDHGEEDFKRIGQVLAKKTLKNPLLIGVSANNMLTGFIDSLRSGKVGFLPTELQGLNVISIDNEIYEFFMGNLTEEMMGLKFKEVIDKVERCPGHGVIVNLGELTVFVHGGSSSAVDYVVSQLSSLVEACSGKLWLIGAVGSYENYMKLMAKFPELEKRWDLNLLSITSSQSNSGGSHLKSSLMGSFVPFGGFFSVSSELDGSPRSTDQSLTRCDLCNKKCEHEVSVILKGGSTASMADQQPTSMASWLETRESDISKGTNKTEAEDHSGALNAQVMGLQRKWNDICQRLHQSRTAQQNSSQIRARVPFLEHFQSNAKRVESSGKDVNQYEGRCGDPSPSIRGDSQNTERTHQPVSFEPLNNSSVTTDLGLGPTQQVYKRSISAVVDEMKNGPGQTAKPSEKDFKQLCSALAGKVRDQDDAICAISQTVARCRAGNSRCRGDIWLMFLGPDRIGKKKIATALAEVVFGSRENLVSVDLDFESRICNPSSIFDLQGVNFCDSRFRGKTITDHIAEELSKKPHSVVLLEHIDKADLLAQDSLSRAIRTGKLPDTHGREISINDVIFVTTLSSCKQGEEIRSSGRDIWGYSEERILNAKALRIQISAVSVIESSSSNVLIVPKQSFPRNPTFPNKRKYIETNDFEITVPEVKKSKSCFDLNRPVEEAECIDNYGTNENDPGGGTKAAWLQEFLEQVDEKVVFRPFDFDSIAESMLKRVSLGFQKAFGSNVQLEIEIEVMVQMLAAYWLSDEKKAVEDWMDTILWRGFMEAKQKLCVDGESMVKLAAVEGVTMVEGHAHCGCLPGRIILNQ